jgi:hypothetical protein
MHIRLGDYKHCGPKGQVLSQQYYFDCIERSFVDPKNVLIVTDEPEDEYLLPFKTMGVSVKRGSEKEDFWELMRFSSIACGNSSYSWWSAFISNAERIYIPSCWLRGMKNKVNLTKIQNGAVVPATFMNREELICTQTK